MRPKKCSSESFVEENGFDGDIVGDGLDRDGEFIFDLQDSEEEG
jgi:hypothetical protein